MKFYRDERGLSEVLGAVLVFALAISLLAIFQINAVPAANEDIEFEHDQLTQSQLQEMRTAVIESSGSGEPRASTLDLGVTYPSRLLLVNPGPVAGTLQTVDAPGPGQYQSSAPLDQLDLATTCGTSDLEMKHLTYGIDYNVYRGESVSTYENTAMVQRYENSDASLVRNTQVLVQGNTINLFVLTGDLGVSGTTDESITFISGGTGTDIGPIGTAGSTWALTVPTELDRDEWRTNANLLANQIDGANAEPNRYVDSVTDGGSGAIDVNFEGGKEYVVRCTVVGINEDPGTSPTDTDDSVDPGDTSNEINPNAEGALVFKNSEVLADGTTVSVTWENIASSGDIEVTQVRFPFYSADSQGNTGGENADSADFDGTDIVRGGPFESYSATVNPGGTLTVDVEMYCDLAQTESFQVGTGDYFAVSLRYTYDGTETGSTYFISPVSDFTGNKRCSSDNTKPSIDQFALTDNGGSFDIDWAVSDDTELSTVIIEVANKNDPADAETRTIPVSGTAASGTENFAVTSGERYDITLTVSDAAGNEASSSINNERADGN